MADENRLINPDTLIDELTGMKIADPHRKKRGLIERWVRDKGYDILILIVKHFPTVDAVEVIRCRDCKHRHGTLCWMIAGGPAAVSTRDNFFCAYGERRTNDG